MRQYRKQYDIHPKVLIMTNKLHNELSIGTLDDV